MISGSSCYDFWVFSLWLTYFFCYDIIITKHTLRRKKWRKKYGNYTQKVKVIGTETYIKQDTGELKEMQVIDIEERDANFHKLWLGHILQSIDLIGNQKHVSLSDPRPSGQQ